MTGPALRDVVAQLDADTNEIRRTELAQAQAQLDLYRNALLYIADALSMPAAALDDPMSIGGALLARLDVADRTDSNTVALVGEIERLRAEHKRLHADLAAAASRPQPASRVPAATPEAPTDTETEVIQLRNDNSMLTSTQETLLLLIDQHKSDLAYARELLYLMVYRLGGRVEVADHSRITDECQMHLFYLDGAVALECLPPQMTAEMTLPCGHTLRESMVSLDHYRCGAPRPQRTGWKIPGRAAGA